MISETKIDEKFPLSHFKIDAFNLPFRLDRSSSGVGRGLCLLFGKRYPVKTDWLWKASNRRFQCRNESKKAEVVNKIFF